MKWSGLRTGSSGLRGLSSTNIQVLSVHWCIKWMSMASNCIHARTKWTLWKPLITACSPSVDSGAVRPINDHCRSLWVAILSEAAQLICLCEWQLKCISHKQGSFKGKVISPMSSKSSHEYCAIQSSLLFFPLSFTDLSNWIVIALWLVWMVCFSENIYLLASSLQQS